MDLPEFIVVELDSQFIIARKANTLDTQPPTYRKIAVAVSQPASEFIHASLAQTHLKRQARSVRPAGFKIPRQRKPAGERP